MPSPQQMLWNAICQSFAGLGDAQPLDLLWWVRR